MSNGRSFDPEIADVILQAASDGILKYEGYVEIVRKQADLRAAELRREGAPAALIEKERRRWGGFTASSITHWKRLNGDFEDELMRAEERAALDASMPEILSLGDEAMRIADDTTLSVMERKVRILGLKVKMGSRMFRVTSALTQRRSFHSVAAPAALPELPTMPRNRRFELPAAQNGGGDDVN